MIDSLLRDLCPDLYTSKVSNIVYVYQVHMIFLDMIDSVNEPGVMSFNSARHYSLWFVDLNDPVNKYILNSLLVSYVYLCSWKFKVVNYVASYRS